MKWGSGKASQFKFATESVQVGDHSGLTAYSTVGSGPEEVAIGQKVITANGHFLNGLTGGQQSGGKTMRHGIGQTILPASTTVLTSALALYGTDCAQLEEGEYLWQEISHDILPHYRRVIVSVYASKQSASDGTLALDWSVDHENVTVTSATADTVTDTSLSMNTNEHADKTFLLRDGDGEDQELTIASNTSDTLTFTTEFATIPSAGDIGDVLDWQSPTMKRLDEVSGTVTGTGTVRGYAYWERFFVVFRPTTAFNRVYARLRSVSGTILLDAAQFEVASRLSAGVSTGATATTLTNTNGGWVVDAQIGNDVIVLDGDDEGDCQSITDNDQTVLTAAFAATPSATSVYIIVPSEGDCRPTLYQDTSAVSMAFGQIMGFDITAGGTLRVGGIKGSLPRFIVDDASQRAIIIAGDNLDASGFRGVKLLRGVGLALEGGSVIARPDKGSADSGQRMKLSHEGLMAYNSSDVLKLSIYSTGEWEQVMGTSPLQARLVANSTDGFAAYDAQGGKWWGVNPVTKHWWLGEPGGDYAIEFTAATGVRVDGGALVEGSVVFAGLGSDISGRLFDSSASSDNIQAWVHANDVTLIDGGDIYTHSIIGDAVSLQSYLAIKSNTWQAEGIQLQYNSGSPRMYVGDGSTKYMQFTSGGDLIVNGAKVTGIAAGSETAIQNWLMDVTFSSSDLDTVAWTSGTLYMLDGTTYSIDAGNTGNMSALTFIYLDIGTSETVLQTTTTISNTIGTGKILLAVAQNTATTATFQVLGGRGGVLISADSIAANCITAAKIVAGTITSTEIAANTLVVGDLASAVTDLMFDTAAAGNNIQAWVHASDVTLIDGGDIYTGSILVAGLENGIINRMFGSQATADNIQAWVHASDVTLIDGGDIYTGSITAEKLTVSELSAIAANLGAVTAGSIVVGTTNKLWLNEGGDGKLSIGGVTKDSAPFRAGPTGAFTATNANITGTVTSTAGTIGGFTLAAGSLTSGDLKLDSANKRIYFSTAYLGWLTDRIRVTGHLTVTGDFKGMGDVNANHFASDGHVVFGSYLSHGATVVVDNNRDATFNSLAIDATGYGIGSTGIGDFLSLKIGGNYGFDSSRNCVVNSLSIGATSVITSARVLQNIASATVTGATTVGSLKIAGTEVITSEKELTNIASASVTGTVSAGILAASTGADISGTMQCNALRIDQGATGGDPTTNAYFTISLNGATYKVPCVAA